MDGTKAFEGLAHTIILCVRKLYSTGGTKCQSDQYDMPFLGTSLTAWSATVPARRTIGMEEIAFAFGECVLFPRRRQLLAESKPIKLGSRAFDTLVVLVEAEGKLVTKNELLKRVWHDTTVEEKNIAAQIAAVRRALRNGDELVKTDAGRGYRFTGTVRRIVGEPVTAPVSVPSVIAEPSSSPSTNLSVPLFPLIGRERELSELQDLMSSCRLLTLTGAGGIGKTKLGFEAARLLIPKFPDGVWAIELAPLMEPELVPSAIARTLRIASGSNRNLIDQLVAVLNQRHMLLVIDNCEHLIEAVAYVTETLLRGCPSLHIVATSREPLAAEGEQIFRVSPLAVPPADIKDVGRALAHSAVQLFVERMRAADRSFVPDTVTLPGVSKICRHLDGLPLAIELAAGCAASIGVDALVIRLDDRFQLLTGGRRCALPRHQTLAATLDWSYALLTAAEQAILRRIAVFAGSFTLESASAIAATDDIALSEVADHIARLVRKSLVTTDIRDGAGRYRLLETTRAYAREKLAGSGEFGAVARRHAEYYREMLERTQGHWRTIAATALAAKHAPDIDNIRSAINWAFERGGNPELGIALTAAAVPLWTFLSILGECQGLVEVALSHLRGGAQHQPRHEMQLQAALARSSMWARGAVAEVYGASSRALDLAEQVEDTEGQLDALYSLWIHQLRLGRYRSSLNFAKKLQEVARRVDDMPAMLTGGRIEGVTLLHLGDYRQALEVFHFVLDHMTPDIRRIFMARFGFDQFIGVRACMAQIAWFQGFPEQASRIAQQLVDEVSVLHHANSQCVALSFGVCGVATYLEDVESVARFLPLLVSISEQHGLKMWAPDCRAFQGWIALKRGDTAAALRLLEEASSDPGEGRVEMHQHIFAETYTEALARLGRMDDAFAAIDRAIADSTRHEGYWCLPELLRIRAELTLRRPTATARYSAEKDLRKAVDLAGSQRARSWQLRAATSLAKVLAGEGRLSESRELLLPIFDWFTEGFATRDLTAAKAVVAKL
jgi:predicted ATPase/DNA-binding winged helix-turn-helix (wHTH) protein